MLNVIKEFNLLLAILCGVIGYILGNIQTAIIVSRYFYHDDVRNHGSGNAGSTNMIRVFGIRPGAVTFLGDFGKAVIGVIIGWLLMGKYGGYIAGIFVVIGHCWPLFARFRGGKGVASSCGLAFMTNPLGCLIALAVSIAVFIFSKKVSLTSLVGVTLFAAFSLVFKFGDWWLLVMTLALMAVVYLRHSENIKRLLKNQEPKLIPKEQTRVR